MVWRGEIMNLMETTREDVSQATDREE